MADEHANATTPQFSVVIGGPFHRLLKRLGLLGPDQLPGGRAALALMLTAWLPPALLAFAQFLHDRDAAALSYFSDYTAYIRFLIAIGVMVVTERIANQRVAPLLSHFTRAQLIHESSATAFERTLQKADERSSSTIAELVILVVVMLVAVASMRLDLEVGREFGWDGAIAAGRAEYSWAGWWSHWIGKPIFLFLVLRWCWRFAVWGWLLLKISNLRLQLVAYHPDRCGGLGFLSVYPTVFGGFILALSCQVAAQLVSEMHVNEFADEQLRSMIVAWIGFVFVIFVGPLTAFVRPLYRLREQAIFDLGRIASEHQRAFRQKWVESGVSGRELLGSADVSSACDIVSIASSPYSLRTFPINLSVLVQVALAAGLPMLAVVLTQVPLGEFLRRVAAAVV